MFKGLVRVVSFFAKELAEIRRQPRLILSLVLGPFLILALFGVGYSGEQPRLKTILVVPQGKENDPQVQNLTQNIGPAFEVVRVTSNLDEARQRLNNAEADIIEVMPPDIEQVFGRTEQAPITVLYNEIDPLQEQWIQYLTYVQVKELNSALLVNLASGTREQAGGIQGYIEDARQQLQTIESGLRVASSDQTRAAIQRLRSNSGLVLAGLVLSGQGSESEQAQRNVQEIQGDLAALEAALASGRLDEQRERIEAINTRLREVEGMATTLKAVPPEVLVSPLATRPENIAQTTYEPSYITFYSPGVVALLLQHMAVTLAALSLVRENLLGTVELFRVAPVGSMQILLGKYLGYTLFAALIATALTLGLYYGLGVPFVGDPFWYALVVLLLTWASLGLGFLISAVSKSESQAVQLSMIALLGSVFFSGFFLPLANFTPYVRSVSYILPVTHGVQGFQDIMLRGRLPGDLTLAWLGGIALVCFVLAWQLWRRNLKQR
ncbi:MAG TPA: ABC transporter permease [Herpetosiphonaceae bacterium]|nr:ABC transporter permease [Herpetosiphonaceae bacterium]